MTDDHTQEDTLLLLRSLKQRLRFLPEEPQIREVLTSLQEGAITVSRATECMAGVIAGNFTKDWLPQSALSFDDELPSSVIEDMLKRQAAAIEKIDQSILRLNAIAGQPGVAKVICILGEAKDILEHEPRDDQAEYCKPKL
jgi:hypothetical protein